MSKVEIQRPTAKSVRILNLLGTQEKIQVRMRSVKTKIRVGHPQKKLLTRQLGKLQTQREFVSSYLN